MLFWITVYKVEKDLYDDTTSQEVSAEEVWCVVCKGFQSAVGLCSRALDAIGGEDGNAASPEAKLSLRESPAEMNMKEFYDYPRTMFTHIEDLYWNKTVQQAYPVYTIQTTGFPR